MSVIALLGAIETGLLFGLVALGVYLSFRILNFPDLTVDGSLPLGAGVAAVLILAGVNPYLATIAAFVAGAMAGTVTAWLNVRLGILHLLASILVMISLHTVNLRVMGKPNVALLGENTVFTPFEGLGLPFYWVNPLVLLV
ncbi:MAG: ABC transporter permease, partial [Ectothiorhodospiraceae bacterium]